MSEKNEKVTAPKGLITPKQAKILDQAFDARYKLVSRSVLKRDNNRSTWYALDEIENFLAYAKAQATELGYELDGIRIYEGAYPETKGEPGFSTMFIVPTGTATDLEKTSLKSASTSSEDIAGADGLNMGHAGEPPSANYPQ